MIIKSKLGEGTAVSVRLPVIDAEAMQPEAPPPPEPPPPRREPIAVGARSDNVVMFKPQR